MTQAPNLGVASSHVILNDVHLHSDEPLHTLQYQCDRLLCVRQLFRSRTGLESVTALT